ncbi:hypothetical protein KAJ27_21710 [bacterium]|nr:hypothetical protein [bacterium]
MNEFKTLDYFILIFKNDINYFVTILEGYEGGSVCTTIQTSGSKRMVRVIVAPYFNEEFMRLCRYFRNKTSLFEIVSQPEWYKDSIADGDFGLAKKG